MQILTILNLLYVLNLRKKGIGHLSSKINRTNHIFVKTLI